MAIKINAGAAPRLGRITAPQGTYLPDDQPPYSNPSTSADGQGQGPSGTNPAQPSASLGTLSVPSWERSFWNPRNISDFGRGVQGWWNSLPGNQERPQVFYNEAGVPTQYQQTSVWNGQTSTTTNPIAFDARGNRYTYDVAKQQYVRDSTNTLDPNKDSPTNAWVGESNLASIPKGIVGHMAKQIFPGLTDKQRQAELESRGYTRIYQPGIGEYWVKSSESQVGSGGAVGGAMDSRGRPEYVDPTRLEPGERVTAASGLTFVGGTPTEGGDAQYAVTIPGGQDDERYKWASSVRQNEDGSWQRTYRRVARAQYSRNWRKKQQQRREEKRAVEAVQAQQAEPSQSVVQPQQYGQLVNLRADFG